jgi:hypothetical protein
MRRAALVLAGCGVALTGCRLAHSVAHTLVNEPIEYLDEKKVTAHLRKDGRKLLREWCGHHNRAVSEDFEDGFEDGYADYLEHGGVATPPAVPPPKYRRSHFLNPDGHARVRDYFAGFQAGVDMAAASGRREYLTVPILIPDPAAEQPVNVRQTPLEQCRPTVPPPPPPASEVLPPPRPTEQPTAGLSAPARPLVGPSLPVNTQVVEVPPLPPAEVPPPKSATPAFDPPPEAGRPAPLELLPPNPPADSGLRPRVPPLTDTPRQPGRSPSE